MSSLFTPIVTLFSEFDFSTMKIHYNFLHTMEIPPLPRLRYPRIRRLIGLFLKTTDMILELFLLPMETLNTGIYLGLGDSYFM